MIKKFKISDTIDLYFKEIEKVLSPLFAKEEEFNHMNISKK